MEIFLFVTIQLNVLCEHGSVYFVIEH